MSNSEDKMNRRNVHLGFPNAALDSADVPLDLNKLVVKNRSSTFYMRVESSSYDEMGIYSGDIVCIDRALEIRPGDVFVGSIDGEFVLRRMTNHEDAEIAVFGAVTYVIHALRGK